MKSFKLALSFCLFIHTGLTVAQTCNTRIIADAPDSRYTTNADGTVLDNKTALTWMRCALGHTWSNGTCTGSVKKYSWKNALQAADSAVFAANTDWRLPNQKELQSLVENRCYSPAINLTVFPNTTNDWFWSSSPNAFNADGAWIVHFGYGAGYGVNKNGGHAVRLVRGGQ